MKNIKIALVHDYLNQTGGGERVLEALYEIFPEATIYTSIYDEKLMSSWLKIPKEKIKTNFISKLPLHNYLAKHYFFLYPLAFRLQNLDDADLVISTCSYASKFVRPKKGAVHICYLHTVPRFLWGYDTELSRYYRRWFDRLLAPIYLILVPLLKALLRRSDYNAASKVDYFLTNSNEVKKRIKSHYKRDSVVIYPPVDTKRFQIRNPEKNEEYYLVVSRLGGYKKVDIAIEAFNKLGANLKVVGDGPQFQVLKSMAKANVEILGRLSDSEITNLMVNAKALVFPTHEDFGIVPVEAMAAGVPVIAFGAGGALETVIEGKTGVFFEKQTPEAIINAVKKFETMKIDPEDCRKQAKKFSKEIFKEQMRIYVNKVVN